MWLWIFQFPLPSLSVCPRGGCLSCSLPFRQSILWHLFSNITTVTKSSWNVFLLWPLQNISIHFLSVASSLVSWEEAKKKKKKKKPPKDWARFAAWESLMHWAAEHCAQSSVIEHRNQADKQEWGENCPVSVCVLCTTERERQPPGPGESRSLLPQTCFSSQLHYFPGMANHLNHTLLVFHVTPKLKTGLLSYNRQFWWTSWILWIGQNPTQGRILHFFGSKLPCARVGNHVIFYY